MHEERETITVDVYIPPHEPRTSSPIFRASRKHLIEDNPNAKCEVCGATDELELHHRIEWCYSNAVDWEKIKKDVPEFEWNTFDPTRPELFIDSIYNANVVLCRKHHTGKDHGIHFLPYPIFLLQKYKREDFQFSPDEQLSLTFPKKGDNDKGNS